MLKSVLFILFFTLQAGCHAEIAVPPAVKALQEKGDYKGASSELKAMIQKQPRAEYFLLLAENYLYDQQEEEAFLAYLQCLSHAEVKSLVPSKREQEHFDSLFTVYLERPQELEVEVKKVLDKHPNSYLVQYFLAAALANKRDFGPFFRLFYQSYINYPESFMAHKTKGVVASLLYNRARELDARERQRVAAIEHFTSALKLMPKDKGLHRMLLATCSEKDREAVVRLVIETIVHNNVVVLRQEIPFYVNHALMVQNPELAQLLLDKAKSWYEYSRILQELQTQIDQQKK